MGLQLGNSLKEARIGSVFLWLTPISRLSQREGVVPTERSYSTVTKSSALPPVFHSCTARQTSEVLVARRCFGLLPIERKVNDLVAAGYTSKESAQWLGVSEIAFKSHLATILAKLSVANLFELLLFALYHQLVGETPVRPSCHWC